MTDKPTPTPSDAELKTMWQLHAADIGGILDFARAVLAKWGAPAGAGEPDFYTACAWHEGGCVGEWIALPGYSNETEHGVKDLVLKAARNEGYKGTADGRLLELGWEIRPVFLTPQPTHAQAGAVPLPKSYQASVLTSNSHDSGCRVSFSFGSVAEAEAWYESLIDQRHGIKGGQHGTDQTRA